MKTRDIIEGMTILLKYYDNPDKWYTTAEHDVIHMDVTDKPVSPEDLSRLIGLGWFQQDVEPVRGGDFEAMDYDAEEGWCCFV